MLHIGGHLTVECKNLQVMASGISHCVSKAIHIHGTSLSASFLALVVNVFIND